MLGKNGQAFILPPCSAIGWGLPEKTELNSKAEADPEGTDSWRSSDHHIPWCWVAKSSLGEGSECCSSVSPEISLNIPNRGWLTIGQESRVKDSCIRWDLESDDPIGPFQLLGPRTVLRPGLVQATQVFCFSCSLYLAQAPAFLPALTIYALPCPTSRSELLLSFWDSSCWFLGTKSWSL